MQVSIRPMTVIRVSLEETGSLRSCIACNQLLLLPQTHGDDVATAPFRYQNRNQWLFRSEDSLLDWV